VSLTSLRAEAAHCRACPLWRNATQTVFGEGPASARMLFVGEQPGDVEDREGRPFVGPAGRIFDEAIAEAGIERGDVYVTNAVKHFKWRPRGKRRIHQKPTAAEVTACRQWLDGELDAVAPEVLVALGATAAQGLLGSSFRVTKERGVPVESDLVPNVLATVHPSSILRAPDEAARREAYTAFVDDLKAAKALLDPAAPAARRHS
jgi:uracil-DNA glycosylase family protein